MDEPAYLLSQLDTLAYAQVERQYAKNPQFWEQFGAAGKEKAVQDARYHLKFLIEAIRVRERDLFFQYATWLKGLFAGLSFPPDTTTETLQTLLEVLNQHIPDAETSLAKEYVEFALTHLMEIPACPPSYISGEDPIDTLTREYVSLLLKGKRDAAFALVQKAFQSGVSIKELYLKVFQRSQQEIGRLWQLNRISVAQEHFCTAATQQIMSYFYPHLFSGIRKPRRIVMACVGKELHEIGARMVADFFEIEGWDTYFIGANTPLESILTTIEEQNPNIVGISVTLYVHLEELQSLIRVIRKNPNPPYILVGGYPFNMAPSLWRTVGADGYGNNAEEAIRVAESLVGKPQ